MKTHRKHGCSQYEANVEQLFWLSDGSLRCKKWDETGPNSNVTIVLSVYIGYFYIEECPSFFHEKFCYSSFQRIDLDVTKY
jgi:hypothetical protein